MPLKWCNISRDGNRLEAVNGKYCENVLLGPQCRVILNTTDGRWFYFYRHTALFPRFQEFVKYLSYFRQLSSIVLSQTFRTILNIKTLEYWKFFSFISSNNIIITIRRIFFYYCCQCTHCKRDNFFLLFFNTKITYIKYMEIRESCVSIGMHNNSNYWRVTNKYSTKSAVR